MFKRFLPFIVLVVGNSALADDCPNAETAKIGFALERQGTVAEVRPASDQFVHVVNSYPGGKKQDVIYYRGLFEISRSDETAHVINVPLSDIRSIFPLDAKSRRAITFARAQQNKVGTPISLELTVAGQEKLQLGSCSYTVLLVRHRYLNGDGRVMSEHTDFYSPDLSFVLAKRYDEKGGRESMVKYERIKPLGRSSPL
ncbi:hypothetical protein AB4072_16805 [Microvirga sp. 2MCAF38]|uniref:hypothetical protein n=1 Tax=Microvirga sp. 2MCAF38 TaxID=3232989 RepID=UPI003F9500F6